MNIYIEKPNEKLYMINVIDLHMLKQNNMDTSNDVFSGSICPVIKIKVMLNDLQWRQVLAHPKKCSINAASKQNIFRYKKAA